MFVPGFVADPRCLGCLHLHGPQVITMPPYLDPVHGYYHNPSIPSLQPPPKPIVQPCKFLECYESDRRTTLPQRKAAGTSAVDISETDIDDRVNQIVEQSDILKASKDKARDVRDEEIQCNLMTERIVPKKRPVHRIRLGRLLMSARSPRFFRKNIPEGVVLQADSDKASHYEPCKCCMPETPQPESLKSTSGSDDVPRVVDILSKFEPLKAPVEFRDEASEVEYAKVTKLLQSASTREPADGEDSMVPMQSRDSSWACPGIEKGEAEIPIKSEDVIDARQDNPISGGEEDDEYVCECHFNPDFVDSEKVTEVPGKRRSKDSSRKRRAKNKQKKKASKKILQQKRDSEKARDLGVSCRDDKHRKRHGGYFSELRHFFKDHRPDNSGKVAPGTLVGPSDSLNSTENVDCDARSMMISIMRKNGLVDSSSPETCDRKPFNNLSLLRVSPYGKGGVLQLSLRPRPLSPDQAGEFEKLYSSSDRRLVSISSKWVVNLMWGNAVMMALTSTMTTFIDSDCEPYFKRMSTVATAMFPEPPEFEVVDPPPGFGEPSPPRGSRSPLSLSASSFRASGSSRENYSLNCAFRSFCDDMLEQRPANTAFAAPAYTGHFASKWQSEPSKHDIYGTNLVTVGKETSKSHAFKTTVFSSTPIKDTSPPPPAPVFPDSSRCKSRTGKGSDSSNDRISTTDETFLNVRSDTADSGVASRPASGLDVHREPPSGPLNPLVVVAIDFGTTYSGYAYSFTRDPDSIHIMRKWEGGDPGILNQKTPTSVLLKPDGEFHSFGFAARDNFHDLDVEQAKKWMYFDKFKMTLHSSENLTRDTEIRAVNGRPMKALVVFSLALRHFKEQAFREVRDVAGMIAFEDIRWVITVPAIWRQPAKQFIRAAAYKAGIGSPESPERVVIALEPEAASVYCRKLKVHQLVPDVPPSNRTRYMVVDCGGGTVDITVHELHDSLGTLREIHKATGGPHGSVGVDLEFERLLCDIFGADFIGQYKLKRSSGWVNLMVGFEARKRSVSPFKENPLNISLPFSFIDYHKKVKGSSVESAIKKFNNKEVKWSPQGMLRLEPRLMMTLFKPTCEAIKDHIAAVLNHQNLVDTHYLFLVGGFAESQVLQKAVREEFKNRVKVIVPQGVSMAILRGAVLFGLDPQVIRQRRSRMTYGVGILNRFVHGLHPPSKKIVKDGIEWCADIFDKFVLADQSINVGSQVRRSYTPAKQGQTCSIIHIYCSDRDDVCFITDPGVQKCATLVLDLAADPPRYDRITALDENVCNERSVDGDRREIEALMTFGETEIKVSALDIRTGVCVKADVDFLSV
ncbi:uncharacterized protein LOC100899882 [Galendromus occidentalis]|uniref:Uncharacterized protein LOC100899882 n=1 Tax=Galendromus occidentalis TaxID=34638 RepID=A0AAJ7SE40_9ACAR|nr:uncharacterized protein LOC100899882 [Galendromus occidentalis]